MKFKSLLLVAVACLSLTACNKPNLETGGAYAPSVTNRTTNSTGEIVEELVPSTAPETILFSTDAAYRFAYESAISVFEFEKENRAVIAALAPKVTPALDKARDVVWDIDQRWAKARQSYKKNPTPAGLTAIQNILSEMQRILPAIQSELNPYLQALSKPQQ